MRLKDRIKKNETLKAFIHLLMVPKNQARPRLWVKWFINPFIHKKGKGACIRRRTRIDVLPWNVFDIGSHSTIEDFTTINNGVGPVNIGNNTRIGIGNTLIGPVNIGNDVRLAQNVVLSGLNHNYDDITRPIHAQGVSTATIHINDATWVGSNSVIVAGVSIGKHCVVAGGSVVTKDVPDYSIVAGNPAKIIKRYDHLKGKWQKVLAPKDLKIA